MKHIEMAQRYASDLVTIMTGERGDDDGFDEAIANFAQEIEVKDGWRKCHGKSRPLEYRILLCSGGPAVRIIGFLTDPVTATLQAQNWGTPWVDVECTADQQEALREYVECLTLQHA
jgi:hypothetical protein